MIWHRSQAFSRIPALAFLLIWTGCLSGQLLPIPPFTPDPAQVGRISRTLSLLNQASSTEKPTVRVMFYGQSHTQRDYWKYLTTDLIAAYPDVRFVVTNKAVTGFQAAMLAPSVFADVEPWRPDLIILQCLASHVDDFDHLYSNLRKVTTADLLVEADHINESRDVREPSEITDPLFPSINYYRNYLWLPEKSETFSFCFADIRTPWKAYLRENQVSYTSLLLNDVFHTNYEGDLLKKQLLMAFLRPAALPPPIDPWNNPKIQTLRLNPDSDWDNGEIQLRFVGNRIDVVFDSSPPPHPVYSYSIDGIAPGRIPELRGFDRATMTVGVNWPAIMRVSSQALLLDETWTLTADELNTQTRVFPFTLHGSKTGFDGQGSSDQVFVSNSGRVVIDPEQLLVVRAAGLTGVIHPAEWKFTFDSSARFIETFRPHAIPGLESTATLFVGTSDTPHVLRIRPNEGRPTGIRAIRVYSPSGNAAIERRQISTDPPAHLTIRPGTSGNLELAWPRLQGSGIVETTSSLLSENWAPLTQEPEVTQTEFRIRVPISAPASYFRWRNK